MSNTREFWRAGKGLVRGLAVVSAAFAVMLAAPASFAQEITGAIRGTVSGPDGTPEGGATVTITDTRTGSTRTVTTSESGAFNVRNLTIGGPYTIRVSDDEYKSTQINDVFTSLSGATSFNIVLETGAAIEEIVTVASAVATTDVAIGPSSSFDFQQISAMPTISRQIRDVIRIDPRVNIGRGNDGNGFGISCLGGNNRLNAFTIDGIASADGFGLNASGNSSRNNFPIPFDAVSNASVEFAPMDVQYGRFTGCNVNVVTRSGTNEWQGSAFYLFNDNDTTADELDGVAINENPFENETIGFDIGGPIIKDKLFFYAAYEENDGFNAQPFGPAGAGFVNERTVTLAEANQIRDILANQYGIDAGELVRQRPNTSERIFTRFDWNINEQHRAEFTYTNLEERNLEPDDAFRTSFSNTFELEGTDQEAISLRLYSDWTDRFSTEIRYSTLEVNDIQGPLGGGEAQNENIPRIIVDSLDFQAGPGQFRSANQLDYTLDQLKLTGHYELGGHYLTFGYDLDRLDVFNLFIANATGTLEFADIAALQAGTVSQIEKNGAFSGNPFDAAADFGRDIHSFYLQDTFDLRDNLTVVAGFRADFYDSSDRPAENPIFIQRYGFTNTQAFDGLELFQPRIGLTWEPEGFGDTTVRAGIGRFSGGDPTVHFANSYQNSGALIGDAELFDGTDPVGPCTAADANVLSGGNFTGIPDCIQDGIEASALANRGRVAAVDPDYDLPYVDRYSVGFTHNTDFEIDFFSDWNVQFDYIRSEFGDAPDWIDLTLTENVDASGQPIILPDGRPQFNAIDPLRTGCGAIYIGLSEGYINNSPACDSGGDDQDILLTNGPSGSSDSYSLQLSKTFAFTADTTLDFRLGYAYTDARIGNPANSSTATSSYEENAQAVINQTVIAPAQYANKHNIVIAMNFEHYFFDQAPTQIGLFFRRRSGRPFSYVYDNNTPTTLFGDSDNEERNLFYVPTGPTDPLVDISPLVADGTDDDFFNFLEASGLNRYAGQIAPRNAFEQQWTSDIDIRLQQDIPLPGADHNLKLFFDIENVMNLIDDSNNIQVFTQSGDVGEGVPVLDAALSTDGSQYVYSNFNPTGGNFFATGGLNRNGRDVDIGDSAWRIQLGLRYTFGR